MLEFIVFMVIGLVVFICLIVLLAWASSPTGEIREDYKEMDEDAERMRKGDE